MPAIDPLVIGIGADDPRGSDSVGDDQVPSFAQRGTAARHVDVIAPVPADDLFTGVALARARRAG